MKRNIALSIILTLLTCGLYGIYWMIVLTDEINNESDVPGTSGIMSVVFTLLTCGIYGYYWAYKLGQKVDIIQQKHNVMTSNHAVLFLILQIFGLGIINYCIAQSTLNGMNDPE